MNGGRCGVCGDPFDGPRDHEAGGKYARGVIARQYSQGQTIEVSIELTKSHLGWFEFRLCPNNNPSRRVGQECLNRNLLRLTDGSTRFQVLSWASRVYRIKMQLPAGLVCSQCVLQWKYNAGNSWGCEPSTGRCCLGCGRQEQFYGCADVAISTSGTQGNVGSSENVIKPAVLGRPSSGSSGSSGGSRPFLVGRAEEGAAGGFIPIAATDDVEASLGGLGISGYADLLRCQGIAQVYTKWCRDNCRAGNCSVWLCSRECFHLLG
ncbi:endonuclease-reverse transcriptase [Plakobranchus ocellatus]|uniref:Endonuclease-reverse transcriptase n=1 Tax=Plakobranchus ocellatus TaxID=259542 RepID=A0AAV4AP89_9GAST|nr:endonuclease-reverse transcriptase [Plakobranchus ocellatus]